MDKRTLYNTLKLGDIQMCRYRVVDKSNSWEFKKVLPLTKYHEYYTIVPDYDQSKLANNELSRGVYNEKAYLSIFDPQKIKKMDEYNSSLISNPKLDKKDVKKIRELIETTDYRLTEIATLYKVNPSTISKIKRGLIWRDI